VATGDSTLGGYWQGLMECAGDASRKGLAMVLAIPHGVRWQFRVHHSIIKLSSRRHPIVKLPSRHHLFVKLSSWLNLGARPDLG